MERRESEEKCAKGSGEREAMRARSSILISRVCKPVIINNDCRCVKWMFMNAILMKRHQGECGREKETTEGSADVVIREGGWLRMDVT